VAFATFCGILAFWMIAWFFRMDTRPSFSFRRSSASLNDLNLFGSRRLVSPVTKPYAYLDPDGDGSISPLDVLMIINHINSKGSGEGEGERASSSSIASDALMPRALDIDAYFSALELDELGPSRRRRNR